MAKTSEYQLFVRQRRVENVVSQMLKYLALGAAAVITILPILVIFMGSFKTGAEFNSTGAFDLPRQFTLENYKTAFVNGKMLLGFGNTLFLIVASALGSILTGTMASYVIDRFDFKSKNFIKHLFLWIVLIPSTTAQVSRFQIVNFLHLYNTRAVGIILAMGTDIMAIYIYLQFLESISKSLDESAILDGAGYFRVYWQIIMPLLKPATMTVLIIKGIGIYNDFYTPFLYMPKKSLQVISTALFKFKGPYGAHWEIICAGIMLAVIPTMVLFIALQKQIYSGLVQGAVKQ